MDDSPSLRLTTSLTTGCCSTEIPVRESDLRQRLDGLVKHYKTQDFIPQDPISFPHRYRTQPKTCENVAFISALLAYGRREQILKTLRYLFETIMDDDPQRFIESFSLKQARKQMQSFYYRLNTSEDILAVLERLHLINQEYYSLENFFIAHQTPDRTFQENLGQAIENLIHLPGTTTSGGPGLKFLLAHPRRGGACKRLHLFLRWMVRQDKEGPEQIDFGLWKTAFQPQDLLIPLDTHVANMARKLGLTHRQCHDWRTIEEITTVFRQWNPGDPVIYDFALFGYGIQPE